MLLLKLLEDPLTLVRTLLELTPKDGTTGEVKKELVEELLILTKNYKIWNLVRTFVQTFVNLR